MYRQGTKTEDGDMVFTHNVMLEGPSRIMCKPVHPLKGVQNTNLTEWFQLIKGVKSLKVINGDK